MTEDELKILGAMAAAIAAIIVAVFSAVFGFFSARANQRELEQLKARLSEDRSESDARRSYTYDALKRLYGQYEPIRFHLVESVEAALRSIQDLAETASAKDSEHEGMHPRGNYLRSARVYHLLAPASHFRIMRSRLTLVDLGASKSSHLQYLLVKEACAVLACDRETASRFALRYTPYVQGWRELRQENPARYRRQGFAFGRYDNAVCALIACPEGSDEHVLSFGEFELLARDISASEYSSPVGAALDLFDDFHPGTRPVLWRGLLLQFCLYQLLLHAVREASDELDQVVGHLADIEVQLGRLGVPADDARKTIRIVQEWPLARIRISHGGERSRRHDRQ